MTLTIYILEQYKDNKLTQYWLFNRAERLKDFQSVCIIHDKNNNKSHTYKVKVSYPNDRD